MASDESPKKKLTFACSIDNFFSEARWRHLCMEFASVIQQQQRVVAAKLAQFKLALSQLVFHFPVLIATHLRHQIHGILTYIILPIKLPC